MFDETGNMGKDWFGRRAELVYLKFLGWLVSCCFRSLGGEEHAQDREKYVNAGKFPEKYHPMLRADLPARQGI
jgi:hypothetical protein